MSVLSHAEPITRFAPSPTGYLHIGHAYAALIAAKKAHQDNGRFFLRIENIDQGRCTAKFEDAIFEDLTWLGLRWETAVIRQSERFKAYQSALDRLKSEGLLYPCFCTRKDIRREVDRAGVAPHGPDGPLYPGTCRALTKTDITRRTLAGEQFALRLNMDKAVAQTGPLEWIDEQAGTIAADPSQFGDVVLARKDSPCSYHLAVTVDDHEQGITLVTRGEDLFPSTHIHRLIQSLLDLDTPMYLHHKLIVGSNGKKFSKRDQSATLRTLRQNGKTKKDIFAILGLTPVA